MKRAYDIDTFVVMLRRWLFCALLVPGAITGCTGGIGNGDPDGEGGNPPVEGEFVPAEPTLHRLTRPQLEAAWLDVLGEPLAIPTDLPQDDLAYGFTSISAASRTISPVEAEKYEAATYAVLDQVWADTARRDAFIGCVPASAGDACARSFLDALGERAWRRPLEASEVDALIDVSESVAVDLGDTYQGLRYAAAAVLQSPHFLFRVEIGEPAPGTTAFIRYTSWEMASRLSFLLLDGPPDDELRASAASGALTDAEEVRAQAERLLDDPRSRAPLVRFFRDFMMVRNLDALKKNAGKFPMFSATLGPNMRIEIERMFENVVFEKDGDFRQLFTTRETYLNEELALLYGVEGISGDGFRPVVLPESSNRAGLLTSVGFLAMNAHETQTSPTHRGRFIQINLLCNDIPPPPAGVDTSLPEPEPGAPPTTLRERLDEHRTNPECAGCHARMDPLGFTLENYDAIGMYRTTDEAGLPIDASSEVEQTSVVGGVELGALVAQLPDVGACVARRFFEHAGGHLAGEGEEPSVEELVTSFVDSSFNFKDLVVALVTNDGYRYASSPSATEGTSP